jgi:hypothetical protein
MKLLNKVLLASLPLTLAMGIGCSSDSTTPPSESCRGDKCDDLDLPDSEIADSPCDGFMLDASGRNNRKVAGRLNDPLANLVFKTGDDCPRSFGEIMAKLRLTDTEGCADAESGINTRVVSETAQALDTPTNYRLVTSRKCDGRDTHELLFSLFGVSAGATSLPTGVEVMAFDKEAGVFNYYETDGEEITFFGNSNDMLKGDSGNTRRCAACHSRRSRAGRRACRPWQQGYRRRI